MYRNEPVPRFKCENQSETWCAWFHVPYKILKTILPFFFLVSSSAFAEQGYYTWVDAQGRIHNTPIPESQSQKNREKSDPSLANESEQSKGAKPDEFLTEEQLDEKIKQEKKEKPPFYTRVDADGRVYNEFIPQVDVEFASEEPVVTELLAVPFRLDAKYKSSGCCAQYQESFSDSQKINNADYKFPIDEASPLFGTKSGAKRSLFLSLANNTNNEKAESEESLTPETTLLESASGKRYLIDFSIYKANSDVTLNVVALDSDFAPLYSFADLPSMYVGETWKSFAKSSWSLQLDDSEVDYLIINFNNAEKLPKFNVVVEKTVLK